MKRWSGKLIGGLVALGLATAGCGQGEPVDTAPLDIRGKPISPVVAAGPSDATNAPGATAPAAPPTPAPQPPPASEVTPGAALSADADGVVHVGFDVLAGYLYPERNDPLPADTPPPPTRVPETVRQLNGRQVAVKGFMLPMKLQSGLATELLLMRDQSMCCFGVVPRVNDWVSVKMTGRGVKPIQDQPVTIYGTFEAGEVYENGHLVTIYRLAGERMETALDL